MSYKNEKKVLGEHVFIPVDLDDCIKHLNEGVLCQEDIIAIQNGTEKDLCLWHHSLGQWLRNNWGLWTGSILAKWFNEKGIKHADDMSGIILTSFWRHLNKKPIDLDTQIKFYQNYWKEQGIEL